MSGLNQYYQYSVDSERLATLIEQHTSIPKEKVCDFVGEYGVENMLPCSNILCETDVQREKLGMLFEFKNLYEIVKLGEASKEYRIDTVISAMDYFRNYFADLKDREYVVAAYLKTSLDVIVTKPISAGTLNQAMFNTREIIKEALFCNAHSVVVAHNHPSGNTDVSTEDIKATNALYSAVSAAGVTLLDHIIVAGGSAVSLAEKGYISPKHTQQGITKVATSLSERSKKYCSKAKPLSIKTQLANAKKQLDFEASTRKSQVKSHDYMDR